MDKQEAIETLLKTQEFTTNWFGEDGLTAAHRDQLVDAALGITIAAASAVQASAMGLDIEIPLVGNMANQATFLAMSTLIAAFQMGRASALGDEQK